MFHPNVYNDGALCLDILQNRWSPTYDVAAILTSIQSLLHDPNPARSAAVFLCVVVVLTVTADSVPCSPANAEAAQLYRDDLKEYQKRVRTTVEQSWAE